MHQQTVELQRQIHACQESLSDQLQVIQAAIAGQTEQAAVNQSKYVIYALLCLLCRSIEHSKFAMQVYQCVYQHVK